MARESRVFWARVARKGRCSRPKFPYNGPPLLLGGLMLNRSGAVAVLVLIAACSDRTVTPPDEIPITANEVNAKRPEALAKMFAKGIKNPAFRAELRAELTPPPYREHKALFEYVLATQV